MSWDAFTGRARRLAQTEPKQGSKVSIIGSMVVLAAGMGVLIAILVVPTTAFLSATATDLAEDAMDLPIALEDQPNPQTTRLLAADGSLLAYFYQENRQDVPLDEISEHAKTAIMAIEDNRFYEHGALDLEGTLRALINNAAGGEIQGGSSLTQQLVKLSLVQQAGTEEQMRAATEGSPARKVRELKLAIDFEERHSKDEILERYLNIAYFGDGAHGISAAAHHYFSKDSADLNIRESATLAGLVQNPDEFNPRVFPERALQRRNTVLAVMARQGKIDQETADELMAENLKLDITRFPNGCVESVAAFSCDYIRQFLLNDESLGDDVEERRARLERGGLTIKSTVDLRMQEAANKAVRNRVSAKDRAIGSLAMVEPGTGNVRGVAQSRPMGTDRKAGETFLNFSVPSKYGQSGGFQAGSTFKIFTAVAALKEGLGVGKTYPSPQDMTIPAGTFFTCDGNGTAAWPVKNSTGSGTFDMYRGMRQSVNTYFAQLERDAGLCNTVRAAEDMGITVPPQDQVGPFTLGVTSVSTLDMANAYATVGSGGVRCEPRPVAEILDVNGETVKKYDTDCERVMSREIAAQINDILRGVQQPGGFGHSNGTALNIDSAAKTGTTNSSQAVWYTGYTPELSTASMIAGANRQGQPQGLVGVTLRGQGISFSQAGGSSLSGPMWKDAMGTIQNYLDGKRFQDPPQRAPQPPPAQRGGGDDDDDD
ncbi:transglycosylase domain-containing protein [Aeromicrobium sp. CTD01-1L150]|uniref:transglycosylase domain-containing protein n=1 Tax=Aeromicrobium sp. CTD01-1L150 TaxID=3341830 RepID=UPI0035C1E0D6